MAKQSDSNPTSEEYVANVFHAPDGNEMLRLGTIRSDYEDGDVERSEIVTENLECGDGSYFNQTLMLRHGNDRVLLHRCDACTKEARSSLFRRGNSRMVLSPDSKMRRCWECRDALCEKHYVVSSDNHIRCKRCDRSHFWHEFIVNTILRFIFFKKV